MVVCRFVAMFKFDRFASCFLYFVPLFDRRVRFWRRYINRSFYGASMVHVFVFVERCINHFLRIDGGMFARHFFERTKGRGLDFQFLRDFRVYGECQAVRVVRRGDRGAASAFWFNRVANLRYFVRVRILSAFRYRDRKDRVLKVIVRTTVVSISVPIVDFVQVVCNDPPPYVFRVVNRRFQDHRVAYHRLGGPPQEGGMVDA